MKKNILASMLTMGAGTSTLCMGTAFYNTGVMQMTPKYIRETIHHAAPAVR